MLLGPQPRVPWGASGIITGAGPGPRSCNRPPHQLVILAEAPAEKLCRGCRLDFALLGPSGHPCSGVTLLGGVEVTGWQDSCPAPMKARPCRVCCFV